MQFPTKIKSEKKVMEYFEEFFTSFTLMGRRCSQKQNWLTTLTVASVLKEYLMSVKKENAVKSFYVNKKTEFNAVKLRKLSLQTL